MNSERGRGINPDDYKIPHPNPVETDVNVEMPSIPAEIVAKETNLFAKFRGKAQKLAKVLILFTSLNLGYSDEKNGDIEKSGYTLEEALSFKEDSRAFLENARYFKDIPGLNLAQEILKVNQRETETFFENAKYFKDIPGLNLVHEIQVLSGYYPHGFLKNAQYFKDLPELNLIEKIVEINESDPIIFLNNAKYLEDIPGLNLGKEILKAKAKITEDKIWESSEFIKNAQYFKDIPGLNLAQEIKNTIIHDPKSFIENAQYFKDIPELNLVQEILQITTNDASLFLKNAKNLKDIPGLDLGKEIIKAKNKEILVFLENAQYFKDIPGLSLTHEIIDARKRSPGLFIARAENFKDIVGLNLKYQIEQASLYKPESFLLSITNLKDIFSESELSLLTEKIFKDNPRLLRIERYRQLLLDKKKPQLASTEILKKISNTNTLILLNHMVRHGLSESAAEEIMHDENKFLKTLVEIKSEPDHSGKNDVENALKNQSLGAIYKINDLHEESNLIRFASVDKATPSELYTMMVYGEEEVFTSTFNGLFDILIKKMHENNFSGKKLLEQVGQNKFRTFIKECSSFNRLNEFLDTMDKESAEQLLSGIVSNIDTVEDKLAQATIVADIFSNIKNEDMLRVLQKQIKLEYERVTNSPEAQKDDKIIYGILSGMFAEKAVVNETWIKEMADKFKLENLTTLKSSDLFNTDNTNVQQYFFYDDEDGHASFKHFLDQYQNQPDWHITKKEHFVLIKQEKNGKILEIYANYPKFQTEGSEEIDALLKEKNIQTITVVHRGHSFHAQQTIDRIPPTAKIVSLGSCGGYSNIEQVLKRAPKAHILSTKGTGTMLVNDPLLKTLNMEILSGRNIEWPTFWEKIQKKVGNNDNFEDYVPPHKNLGAMFLKTYFQELEK
jgi:hypothetical protein